MSLIVHSYSSGGVTYNTVRSTDGVMKRNGCLVCENRNGRRYVLTNKRRKKYLCIEEACYKNSKFGSLCRDHAPEEEKEKIVLKPTESELLWKEFNNLALSPPKNWVKTHGPLLLKKDLEESYDYWEEGKEDLW